MLDKGSASEAVLDRDQKLKRTHNMSFGTVVEDHANDTDREGENSSLEGRTVKVSTKYDTLTHERDNREVRHIARRPQASALGFSFNYTRWDTVLADRVIYILSYTHYRRASPTSEATLDMDEKTDEETLVNKVTIKGE